MNKTHTTYRELKNQLDEIMDWFEQDDIDIDEAMQKFTEAESVIKQLETYLENVEQKIETLKGS